MNNTYVVVDTEYFLENIKKQPFISAHFPYGKNVVLNFVVSREHSIDILKEYLTSLKKLTQQVYIYKINSVYYNMFRYELLYSCKDFSKDLKTYFYAENFEDFYDIKDSEQIRVEIYKIKNNELVLFSSTKNYVINDKNRDYLDNIILINPNLKTDDIKMSDYTKQRETAFNFLSCCSKSDNRTETKLTKTKLCTLEINGSCNRKTCNFAHHFNELSYCLFGNTCKLMFANSNRCPFRHPIENAFMFCTRTNTFLPEKMIQLEEKEKTYKIPKNMVNNVIQNIINEGVKNVRIEIVN